MYVMTVKSSTIKISAILFALGVLIAVAAWPRGDLSVTQEVDNSVVGVSTNAKRVAFLEQYGWKVEENPIEVVEVNIPLQFNNVYNNYNKIQKKQGLDLSKYKGKRVKRWTYKITNYPNSSEEVRANLLIYDNRVIGGDVSTVALNGFMHGFSMTSAVNNPGTDIAPQQANITSGIFD